MNDLRTAAQHTLEALEHHGRCLPWNAFVEVRKDLRDALAQQAEPTRSQQMVAAGFKPRDRRLKCDDCGEKFTAQMLPIHKCAQQAEPVEPVAWNWMLDGLPYGQAYYGNPPDTDIAERAAIAGRTVRLLYTAPPQRKPLTEEEILKAIGWERAEMYMKLAPNFPVDEAKQETLKNARAVERAVWEKNHG